MTALHVYDDARARNFEPFALTRPCGELRAGAELIRHRWERVAGARAAGFAGAPHLAAFDELDVPRASTGTLAPGTIVANARFAPALDGTLGGATVWRCDGRVVAVRLAEPLDANALTDGTLALDSLSAAAGTELRGWWIDEVWDLVRHLGAMLSADIPVLAAGLPRSNVPHLTVLGEHPAHVAAGAYVEPLVLADTTAGPVLVRDGAHISAFTRLTGPCVIGEHARVRGGSISGCSIGDHARVHGELSATVVIGHTNKSHDGFVGHSVLGRWVNLGAGSITSNLKNSYGEISVWTPGGTRHTGMQFLGALIGDHAKTGIGTRLTTGSVVGAGANVFGSAIAPKFVPPFAWGDAPPFGTFELDKFLEVTERVLRRRDLSLTEGSRRTLERAWAARGVFQP